MAEVMVVFGMAGVVAIGALTREVFARANRIRLLEAEVRTWHSHSEAWQKVSDRLDRQLDIERDHRQFMWKDMVELKRDGFVQRPTAGVVGPKAEHEPMTEEVQTLLAKYPSEFRAQGSQWVRDQRRLGAPWDRIAAHLRGDGQGWRRADDTTREQEPT